jgi:phenylalanyl-tRNA synthetase beta chain
VNVGQEKPLSIICGAPNVVVGMKAPVAMIGTTLPNGMTIERRPIRGIPSEGMMCAEDELGLGTSHEGLLVLPEESRPGQSFVEVLGLDDVVLDLSIPSNRADLLSMRGLAREIGALLGIDVRWPAAPTLKEKPGRSSWKPLIDVGTKSSIFALQAINGITMNPTPSYIVRRLRACGIRSVNIVVDCTNYVMLECGQPLHAYDASTLHGNELTVRTIQQAVDVTTLDGEVQSVPAGSIIIADQDQVAGVAGVIGAQATEVRPETTSIILEAGIFDGPSVRTTARAMKRITEASRRFERGLWPSSPRTALEMVRALLVSMCDATLDGDIVVVGTETVPATTMSFDPTLVEQRLGIEQSTSETATILERFGYQKKGKSTWSITVPEWRPDVRTAEDILDDIGRVCGYEALPTALPATSVLPEPLPIIVQVQDRVRDALVQLGGTEVILHATYGEQAQQQSGTTHLEVANPIDTTQRFLRVSLLPGIDRVVTSAVDAGSDAFVFEIGRVFTGGGVDDQPWKVGIGIAKKQSEHEPIEWEMNGILTTLAHRLHCTLPPTQPFVRTEKGRTIACVEFDLSVFRSGNMPTAVTLQTTPSVERDITVTIPADRTYAEVVHAITKERFPIVQSIRPIAIYDTAEKRNVTLRCVLQDPTRTLTGEEVEGVMSSITSILGNFH